MSSATWSNYCGLVSILLGMYGGIWVITQFCNGRILRNIPGVIILAMGVADVLHSLYYIALFLDAMEVDIEFSKWCEIVFSWEMYTTGLLSILMALNTFSVLFRGRSLPIDRWKYFVVLACFLAPIPLYYWPVSIMRKEPMFSYKSSNTKTYWMKKFQIVYLFSFTCAAILLVLSSYFYIWFRKIRRNGPFAVNSNATAYKSVHKVTAMKLIAAYSLSIIISTIPWMMYNATLFSDPVDYRSGYAKFVQDFRLIMVPLRGYIHALAVILVFCHEREQKCSRFWTVLLNICLVSCSASSSQQDPNSDTAQSLNDPEWEISYRNTKNHSTLGGYDSKLDTVL